MSQFQQKRAGMVNLQHATWPFFLTESFNMLLYLPPVAFLLSVAWPGHSELLGPGSLISPSLGTPFKPTEAAATPTISPTSR